MNDSLSPTSMDSVLAHHVHCDCRVASRACLSVVSRRVRRSERIIDVPSEYRQVLGKSEQNEARNKLKVNLEFWSKN